MKSLKGNPRATPFARDSRDRRTIRVARFGIADIYRRLPESWWTESWRLSREVGVQMELPEGVTLQGFQSGNTANRLEPRVEMQLDVEVKLRGRFRKASNSVALQRIPLKFGCVVRQIA